MSFLRSSMRDPKLYRIARWRSTTNRCRIVSNMRIRTFLALFLATIPGAFAQSIAGLWDATVKINDLVIPFRMEFSLDGCGQTGAFSSRCGVTGTFFNGDERFTSTKGTLSNDGLTVDWDQYLSELKATLKDGVL